MWINSISMGILIIAIVYAKVKNKIKIISKFHLNNLSKVSNILLEQYFDAISKMRLHCAWSENSSKCQLLGQVYQSDDYSDKHERKYHSTSQGRVCKKFFETNLFKCTENTVFETTPHATRLQ